MYLIGENEHQQYIQCVTCGHKSYNPNDIKEKYCGYCRIFHDDPEYAKNPGKLQEAMRNPFNHAP